MPGETSRSERMIATGRALWRDPASEPYRRPLIAMAISLALSLLLHALLPDWEAFRGFGAILMGPIPASFGLAIGLYIHRASASGCSSRSAPSATCRTGSWQCRPSGQSSRW